MFYFSYPLLCFCSFPCFIFISDRCLRDDVYFFFLLKIASFCIASTIDQKSLVKKFLLFKFLSLAARHRRNDNFPFVHFKKNRLWSSIKQKAYFNCSNLSFSQFSFPFDWHWRCTLKIVYFSRWSVWRSRRL